MAFLSPSLTQDCRRSKKEGVHVTCVCSESLDPPFLSSPGDQYGSQEIPLMTGSGRSHRGEDQFVNPTLSNLSRKWEKCHYLFRVIKERERSGRFARERSWRGLRTSFDFRRIFPEIFQMLKRKCHDGVFLLKMWTSRRF